MLNYVAFLCGGIAERGATPTADGVEMANKCLYQLEATGNPEQFPPRLLILLTSPAYQKEGEAKELLASIHKTVSDYKSRFFANEIKELKELEDASLIGCSVDAVFFNREVHERGALLICLASRLIEADVRVTPNVLSQPEAALDNLLNKLNLNLANLESNMQKPLTDRLLLTFFPNLGRHDNSVPYLAPELHGLIREKALSRVSIIGGVSSRPSFQYVADKVYRDELVAAHINTNAPFCSSFGHGLSQTDIDLRVKTLGPDHRTIVEIEQNARPADMLNLSEPEQYAVLGELSLDHDPLVTVAELADGKAVRLLRRTEEKTQFRKLDEKTDPNQIRREAKDALKDSLTRWSIEKPAGCFGIHCTARRRAGLNFDGFVADAEKELRKRVTEIENRDVYFGGFFDGEAGVDESGRILFGNWCLATLCVSDEMRERTPAYTGFKAISETAASLTGVSTLEQAREEVLKVVFNTGFPGAMLSMVMNDNDRDWVVAVSAIGSRFEKIREITKRLSDGHDILAITGREKQPRVILDSSKNENCDPVAVKKSGIISQYIFPLLGREKNLIAELQIDIGDLRRRSSDVKPDKVNIAEEHILSSLGAVINAYILRVLNREEADLVRGLDKVLIESLHADNLHKALLVYITQAAALFKADASHIRLLNNEGVLEMVAGTGDYYEAFKVLRRRTALDSNSPTAEALTKQKEVVVNNSEAHPWQQWALKEYKNHPNAFSALKKEHSFANVPIRGDTEDAIGTISLVSNCAWHFTRPRVNALQALAQRVSYLIGHFKIQQDRRFLLDISSDFVRNENLVEQPDVTIRETIEHFRTAANADIASLFILDKEAERFVLRAQYGWADGGWVDAAGYKENERWTGKVALGESPQYVPDMFTYKKQNNIEVDKDYEARIFGLPLSENFTVEAIGLPLRLKQSSIGVLTLYRRIDSSQPGRVSGFTTTDSYILQEAADTISSMLSALLYNLRMDWFKKEIERHEAVREVLEKNNCHISLEERLCRQTFESYEAEQVIFFAPSNKSGLRPLASWPDKKMTKTALKPDEMVVKAAQKREIQKQRIVSLSAEELKNPETAKLEGLVKRVALPLRNGENIIGVLDLRFRKTGRQSSLVAPYYAEQLEKLAQKIAIVYQQQKSLERKAEAEVQAEKGRLAVQAMGAMVFQTSHRLINLTQTIRALSILIESAKSESDRKQRLSELFRLINSASETIKRPMYIARQMKEINLGPYSLEALLAEATLEADIQHHSSSVSIQPPLPDGIAVLVDHGLIIEAFRNIIHNAMKAMPSGGRLDVSATLSIDRTIVRITFEDTGVGMSKEQIEAALSGFVSTRGSTGLGVLVSLLLIRAQDGDLKIESELGKGTTVIVTLPSAQQGERI
ncbi:MAG: GAF domain-containing protein [Acidobacteriota bacterium]|nr:GAF domain-containing protein [Acidobacteriota bacterium]